VLTRCQLFALNIKPDVKSVHDVTASWVVTRVARVMSSMLENQLFRSLRIEAFHDERFETRARPE